MNKNILPALALSFLLTASACGAPSGNTQKNEIDRQSQDNAIPPAAASSADSADSQEKSRAWMEEAISRASEITEENADSYQKCGIDAMWLRKGDMLVFRGTGEIDQITPSDEAKGAYTNDLEFIVYESGLTNTGKNFCCRGGGYVILSDTITTISEGCFQEYVFSDFVIPPNVKEIEANAFCESKFFETLDLPYGLERIGKAAFRNARFYSDDNKNLIIPESVTTIESGAFSNLSISSVYIPDSVQTLGGAFSGCEWLETIRLPSGLTEIPPSLLRDCKMISEVEIPSGVTSIGQYAFSGCESLREITLPESVTEVDHSAFSDNPNLLRIYINNSNLKFEKEDWLGEWIPSYGIKKGTVVANPEIIYQQ